MPATGKTPDGKNDSLLRHRGANLPFLRFAEKLLKAAKGAKGLVEPSYVYLPGVPGGKEIQEKTGVDFFSVPIELGVSCCPVGLVRGSLGGMLTCL